MSRLKIILSLSVIFVLGIITSVSIMTIIFQYVAGTLILFMYWRKGI